MAIAVRVRVPPSAPNKHIRKSHKVSKALWDFAFPGIGCLSSSHKVRGHANNLLAHLLACFDTGKGQSGRCRHMGTPLTDARLRALKGSEKPQKIPDSGGLYIYVSPAGGKL